MAGGFTFHHGPLGWEDARQACDDMGGALASIHSRADELAVLKLIDGQESWIGLSDTAVEGDYLWSDGTPGDYTSALTWAPGEPNDFTHEWEEDCIGWSVEALVEAPASRIAHMH